MTFRLADAMPQEKLKQWQHEREQWFHEHPEPQSAADREEYHRLFTDRLQEWMDAGYGKCILRKQNISKLVEDALRNPSEHQRVSFALHREATHGNVVDAFFASRQFVAPRDVVSRARRPHFDLRMTSQMLGDVARVQFGAPVDGEAVPLDDDRELHCSGVADGSADVDSDGVADDRVVSGAVLAEWVGSLVAVSAG